MEARGILKELAALTPICSIEFETMIFTEMA